MHEEEEEELVEKAAAVSGRRLGAGQAGRLWERPDGVRSMVCGGRGQRKNSGVSHRAGRRMEGGGEGERLAVGR